jgi:azurin/lysophospholipase L1-like esterase
MLQKLLPISRTLLSLFLLAPILAAAQLPLQKADTLLFEGNSLVERILEQGYLQAYLHLSKPDANLRVRSLAWTGDEVGNRLRPEGYTEHLRDLLQRWPAQHVVLGYGMNESFAGAEGLPEFRNQLQLLIRETRRRHPKARLVLLSPIAVEEGGPSDTSARNTDLAAYSQAISEAASQNDALFVDLFHASQKAYTENADPLTTLGIHPSPAGARKLSATIARAFLGDAAVDSIPPQRLAEVALAAAQEARCNADLVRPKNGVVYFGVRKRPEEYAAEIPRYHQLLEQASDIVHDIASHPTKTFHDSPPLSLAPMPEGKSNPDRFGGGTIKSPAEQIKEFTVADGYALNLFASEAEFPELRNPVHMAFDARGRLWVATMPSFPHTVPGAKREDKVIILEDTDRDGRADKSTVFLDDLDALDGIAFHERGVLVSSQPRILLCKDSNGDGRADQTEEVLRGIDVTDSHHGGMISVDPLGDILFCDGVFHRSQLETPFGVARGIDSTTFRLQPQSGRISTEWQSMTPNPWRISHDRYGNAFQRYGGGQILDGLQLTWTPLGIYHPYAHGTVLDYNKGCAVEVISSPNFPASYQQGLASATLLGSYFVSISRTQSEKGPVSATDRLDLLSNPNAAFRPVDVTFGFDGALYVADFSSRIIGHAQHPMRDPQWDHDHGRIWRVVRKDGPLPKDWPEIERASVDQLLTLLTHPQDLVRQHARLRLRGLGREAREPLARWIQQFDRSNPNFAQAALETLWISQSQGVPQPELLEETAHAKDPLIRSAVAQTLRFHAPLSPNGLDILTSLARDPHPRVRMGVIHSVAYLRQNNPAFEKALAPLLAAPQPEPAVSQMLADLKHGLKPAKARSVPVLEIDPASRVSLWQPAGERTLESVQNPSPGKPPTKPGVERIFRTYLDSLEPQSAILSIKHGYLDVNLNGVQLLSADSSYSTEQQVQLELLKGLNQIELVLRKQKAKEPPHVFLFDPTGSPLRNANLPNEETALLALAKSWDQAHAADSSALKVQAVPNLLQFAPKEIHATAGQSVRIVFDNPDLMLHNFVLIAPGAEEEVGALADAMASQPDAMEKNYIPASPKILHHTLLVKPNERAEIQFTAPETPGRYPFLCTFPGHWRVMRGDLVITKNP